MPRRAMVCWKWLGERGPSPLGVSAADEAALEVALTLAGNSAVTVVCCGPTPADAALREALARGAGGAVRIDVPIGQATSVDVAAALAGAVRAAGDVDVVCCGDYSLDRGSGAVPAFLAAELGWPQALGLLELARATGAAGARRGLVATRRLDQGRRERLAIRPPAVLSVEPSAAHPRRAALGALRAARTASIDVRPGPAPAPAGGAVRPFRPRTKVVAPPGDPDALGRVRSLTDSDTAANATEVVTLEPADAATHLLHLLRGWGYVDT